jgi:hypothetical protein
MADHSPWIDRLVWSSDDNRPECPVRGCANRCYWRIRYPVKLRSGEDWSRWAHRCQVHGREWAERNSLKFPPHWQA